MFRFNNPDALLALLLTGAAYATIRASSGRRPGGWCWPGRSIGFGFITKMMQAFLLLPVLAVVYLLAGAAQARAPGRGSSSHGRRPGRGGRVVGGRRRS